MCVGAASGSYSRAQPYGNVLRGKKFVNVQGRQGGKGFRFSEFSSGGVTAA
jgi:hypothetical protein